MKKRIAWSAVVLGLAGTGVGAFALAGNGNSGRADCPGTIVCPLTGETVCRDRCPLNAEPREKATRAPCCAGSRTPKW